MTRQLSTVTAGALLMAMAMAPAPVSGQNPPPPPSRPTPTVARPGVLPGRPTVVAPAAGSGAKPAAPAAPPATTPPPVPPELKSATPAPAAADDRGKKGDKGRKGKKGTFSIGSEGAPAAPGGVVTTGTAEAPGEKEFNSCKKLPAGKRIVKLNMKPDTELGDLVNWISSITCRQFLIPNTIPANSKKVTIVAPQLITPEEAYRLFLASLDSVGLTVEPSGKFLRIIETMKAKSTSIPVYGFDQDMPAGESYVTRMVRVENGDPNEVAQVLARIKGEQGDIVVYPPTGTLIITDQASNIARMMGVLGQIDTPATGEKVWIVRLHNMAASEMAARLAEIFQVAQVGGKKGGSAPPPAPNKPTKPGDIMAELTVSKIIPDERSNQLIILANEKAYARLLQMIRKLDVPLEGGDGRVHVYYCENANCDELAMTLGVIVGVPVSGAQGARTSTRSRSSTPMPTPQGGQGQQGQGPPLLFEGDVRITFDRPTNSLVVLSSLKDYQSLRKVIERLDSPRKQIFVEALIFEISVDRTRQLGASFHGGKPENLFGYGGDSTIIGGFGVQNSLSPATALSDSSALGLLAGIIGPQTIRASSLGLSNSATTDLPAFGVIIKALQNNNDINVISNPHLLITNNDDGEITVGQNLPFPGAMPLGNLAGGAAGAGFVGYGTLSVQRQDVALKLKLTPHVNEHNMIRLEVDQEISDVVSANYNNLGPATSKRAAKTTVVARDQQTIVIGGLMSDRATESVTKIPLLGDIPILGFFFRTTKRTVQKTNILIAMTPYVVNDQSDLRRILERKMKERREFIDRFGRDLDMKFDPEANKDYRRKRGMLEEINRAIREVEVEEREMNEIRQRDLEDATGPLEIPSGFRVGGVTDTGVPSGGGATAPAPAAPAPGAAAPAAPAPATPAPAAPAPGPVYPPPPLVPPAPAPAR